MSGVKRNILAEVTRKGDTSESAVQKAFSPEAQRAEKGRSIHNGGIVKNEDSGDYLGKNGKDATPGK